LLAELREAREREERLLAALEPIDAAWQERKCYGQGTAAFLSCELTFGQIRTASERYRQALALASSTTEVERD
jgi:hypothetical protein